MVVFLLCSGIIYSLPISGQENFLGFIISTFTILVICALAVYFIGITKDEAIYIKNFAISILHLKKQQNY